MALAATAGVEQASICGTWEELDGNADLLEKQLQRLKVKSGSNQEHIGSNGLNGCHNEVVLDSTREESLRTQYVSPEPKVKILPRPKHNNNHQHPRSHGHHHKHQPAKTGNKTSSKTLQQREQEYAEARMRILGDVKFEAEEAQVQAESTAPVMSPAELLKLKVAEAMKGEEGFAKDTAKKVNGEASSQNAAVAKKTKKIREKIKTSNPEPTRDFPVHKTESDRIIRHPRGPDGTPGFNYNRS